MTEALVLALGVPTALVAAWLLWRRSWSQAFADIRGIALQTVIVIVVLLVIAGGVAGVLLSRGSEVITDLENQEITPVAAFTTEATCDALFTGPAASSTYAAGPPPTCTFVGTTANPASAGECVGNGGAYDRAGFGTCTLTRS